MTYTTILFFFVCSERFIAHLGDESPTTNFDLGFPDICLGIVDAVKTAHLKMV